MPQPKSVLITGCSEGGIGPALVESFHAAGLHVYATARSRAKMARLEGLTNVTLLELDVVSQGSIDAAVEVVRKETGSLDILVNNAGINMFKPVLDVSVDEGKRVFDVNIWGVAAMTQAFVPMLIAARGTVVNVSSIAGCLPAPWTGLYNASKAALLAYSETLRLELAPFQVKVMTLVTGAVAITTVPQGDIELPPNSLYHKVAGVLRRRRAFEDVPARTPLAEYADTVVKNTLGGASGSVWTGAMASTTWFATMFMPAWILDWFLGSRSGMDLLP